MNYSHPLNPDNEIQQKQRDVSVIKKILALFSCNYVVNFIIYDLTLKQLGWYDCGADSAQRENHLLIASVCSPFNNNNELVNKHEAIKEILALSVFSIHRTLRDQIFIDFCGSKSRRGIKLLAEPRTLFRLCIYRCYCIPKHARPTPTAVPVLTWTTLGSSQVYVMLLRPRVEEDAPCSSTLTESRSGSD